MSSSTTALLTGSFEAPSVEELTQLLPQFEMQGFIAQGGMGAVYLARQLTLDRLVAIKVLPQAWGSAPKYAERFQYEARAMAKMHHNGIVGVYDFGMTAAGHLYLVMEYVEGETLHELIQTQNITPKKAHAVALQLCDAVAYAHEHGILHRDIKPGNIIINSEGRVKVADFGLARPAEACIEIDALGTPGYAAPELLVEGSVIDHHADIYAIGVVCYEMLLGKLPNTAKRPLSGLSTFDPAWDRAIDKSTRTKQESRFSTVRELRETLGLIGKMARPKVMAPITGHSHAKKEGSFPWLMASVLLILVSIACFWVIKNKGEIKVATGERTRSQQAKESPTWNLKGTPEDPGPVTAASVPVVGQPLGAGPAGIPFQLQSVTPGHVFKLKVGHKDIINDIAIFPDQRHVASCSHDGSVIVWDLKKGEKVRRFDPNAGFLYRIAISWDGQYVTAGGNENKAYVWSVDDKAPLSELELPGRNVLDLAFSPDGNKVLAASSDKAQPLLVWDWQKKTATGLEGWTQQVSSLKFVKGAAGDGFITAGYSMSKDPLEVEIKAGNLTQPAAVRAYAPLKFQPYRMAIADDGRTAAAIVGNRINIFDLESGARLAQTPAIDAEVTQCEFVANGKLLLSAGQGSKLQLWETSTGSEVWHSKEEQTHCTNVFAVSKDETYVVTGGGAKLGETIEKDGDYALHVWQLPANMSELRSVESEKILVHREMLNLETSDSELYSLVTSLCAEWDEKVVKTHASVLADLESKYVNALRRELLSSSPTQKPAVMDEIARVSSHLTAPGRSTATQSPNLQRLIKIFKDQCDALPKRSEDVRKQLIDSNAGKLAAVETQRKARNDAVGTQRVVLLSDAIRAVNGEMVWSKIHAELQTSLQSFQARFQSAQNR
ncbi:hypothetical protein BH11VER1_BH11VER1_13780 [soil metagenome]